MVVVGHVVRVLLGAVRFEQFTLGLIQLLLGQLEGGRGLEQTDEVGEEDAKHGLFCLGFESCVFGLGSVGLTRLGCLDGLLLVLDHLLALTKRATLSDVEGVGQGPDSFVNIHFCTSL
jgi:hypothetical protein